MIKREWKKNAFWENVEKTTIKAILKITNESGVETTQEVTVSKDAFNGDKNPDFDDIIAEVTLDVIDKNTETRTIRREELEKERSLRQEEFEKAKSLELLFDAKLKAFEIEEIKRSNNRALKTRLRRAKSPIEVNIYAMMLVMEELDNEKPSEN